VNAHEDPDDPSHNDGEDTDHFPVKVKPTVSEQWDIEYFDTYKIVTNKQASETYLLYQRGTEPPLTSTEGYAAVVEVPLQRTGVSQTETIAFLEQLGLIDKVVAFTTDPVYISSPCFLRSIQEGNVLVLQSRDELDDLLSGSNQEQEQVDTYSAMLQDLVAFVGPWDGDGSSSPFDVNVKVAAFAERTNAAIFEWIKFYAAFFNLERKANELFEAATFRYDCVAYRANTLSSDSSNNEKKTVLWAYYSDYCDAWDVGECPNYYCEFAGRCDANILSSPDGGTFNEKCGALYMSLEEVVEFGKDADVWIFPAPNWDETYELFGPQLDAMRSVRSGQVYDYQGAGENAWFEERYAEFYDVLQDFCSVAGTTRGLNGKTGWFRNVMDGTVVGDRGECQETDESKTTVDESFLSMECGPLDPVVQETPQGKQQTEEESGASSATFFATTRILLCLAVMTLAVLV
jgi:iron complex transport system substrate-binding protein